MKVIIVGGGQVGAYLAALLLSNGHQIRIIEQSEKLYRQLEEQFPQGSAMLGNGSDPAILEQAGIASAQVVAAVTGEDEVNLVVSTLAKMEFNVARVVALVNHPKNSWLYNSGMGVDVGVNQADILAHFTVEEMNLKDMFTLLKLNRGNYSILQIQVHAQAMAVNHQLKDLPIPQETLLIAIMRGSSVLIPRGDTHIMAEDEILALADEAGRRKLEVILSYR